VIDFLPRPRAVLAALTIAVLAACGKTEPTKPVEAQPTASTSTTSAALADPIAAIRKNLAERLPQLPPIEEITAAPVAGLYEVRLQGADIVYTDAQGNFLIQGQVYDTQQRRNLTEERIDKLTAVDFKTLPMQDAFTLVRGDGKRKLAVFVDPNCGYCKRFERDLENIDNVTIHLFLYPILGADSVAKSQNIWCAKEQAKVWSNWMVRNVAIPEAQCDVAPVARNVEFGRKHKITGTPTLIFADGKRVPGAVPSAEVEKMLVAAADAPKQ
jgi:thiol:disulfide interchange protein DsbC